VHGESFGISGQCFADIKRGCEGKWLILDDLKNSVACYRLAFMFDRLLGMSVLVVASSVWVLMEVDAGRRFWSFCPVDTHCFKAQSTNCRTSYCLIKPCRPVKVVECATWWKGFEPMLLHWACSINFFLATTFILVGFYGCRHLSALHFGWRQRSYRTQMDTMRRSVSLESHRLLWKWYWQNLCEINQTGVANVFLSKCQVLVR
jgi:hypothetical protein